MNFIRFLNQNLKKVLLFVIIVICVILVIQLLNSMARTQMQETSQPLKNTTNGNTLQVVGKDKNTIQDESIISGENIGTQTANKNQEIIKRFIDYCNNGRINIKINSGRVFHFNKFNIIQNTSGCCIFPG